MSKLTVEQIDMMRRQVGRTGANGLTMHRLTKTKYSALLDAAEMVLALEWFGSFRSRDCRACPIKTDCVKNRWFDQMNAPCEDQWAYAEFLVEAHREWRAKGE